MDGENGTCRDQTARIARSGGIVAGPGSETALSRQALSRGSSEGPQPEIAAQPWLLTKSSTACALKVRIQPR